MSTCTLCGNEEVEKPFNDVRLIKLDDSGEYTVGHVEKFKVPYGSYCWKKKRTACILKTNQLWRSEITARGLDKYN